MPFSVATSAFDVLLCEFLVSVRVCVFVSLFLYTYTSLFWVLSKVFERLLCECKKKKKKSWRELDYQTSSPPCRCSLCIDR